MESLGVVSRIPLSSVGFWGHIFVVPKKEGSWRLILDLAPLNVFVVHETFQMVSLQDVFSAVRQSDWMASLDIEKDYWHVPVAPLFRKFFQFRFEDRGFQFRVMPFGLTTAPWIFNRLITPIVCSLVRSGIQVLAYLDDFLVLAPKSSIVDHVATVESTLVQAGFSMSDKSCRTPSRSVQFLGVVISSESMCSSLPVSVQESVVAQARELGARACVSRRLLESFIGTLSFYSDHVFCLRPLFWELTAWTNRESSTLTRDLQFVASPSLRDCLPRISLLDLSVPRSFAPPQDLVSILSDASDTGWGATWGARTLRGEWSVRQARLSINARELKAVVLAISRWAPLLSGRSIQVFSDNVAAAATIRRRGSPSSPLLCRLAQELEEVCLQFRLKVIASHVAGERNVVADSLSRRRPQPSEWSLSTRVFELLCWRWGCPEVDLCATRDNAKTKVFVSPLPTDEFSDCLTLSWGLWRHLYAFPPSRLLRRLVPRLEQLSARQTLILVFSWWERRPWFQRLRSLWLAGGLDLVPLSLERQDLLRRVQDWVFFFHPNPGIFMLHAVLLSGPR